MVLNIKNPEVERLASEVAAMMSETKTEAIRRALEERKHRISFQVTEKDQKTKLLSFLQQEVWSVVPSELLGKSLTHEEEDAILGCGEDGA